MWWNHLEQGGPLMYGVLGAWIVVLAGVLDRALYAVGRAFRLPGRRIRLLVSVGELERAREYARDEDARASAGVARIDAVSQLATSIGLFGTVVGIARGFLSRGGIDDPAASLEGLASGLSTALYTTIGGLAVFLFGQAMLIVYREWLELCTRALPREVEGA